MNLRRSAPVPRLAALGTLLLMVLAGAGCGGGGAAQVKSGSNPATAFVPRGFPGDYAARLPSQGAVANSTGAVYDPALDEVFVGDFSENAVIAFSLQNGLQQIGEIPVPSPAGLSIAPSSGELVIGTATPYI